MGSGKLTTVFQEIPKTDRICVSGLLIYRISNPAEVDVIYEEHPCDMDYDDWLRVYRHATQGKHDFMYVNYQLPTEIQRQSVFRNFNVSIDTDCLSVSHRDMQSQAPPPQQDVDPKAEGADPDGKKRKQADSAATLKAPKKHRSK